VSFRSRKVNPCRN